MGAKVHISHAGQSVFVTILYDKESEFGGILWRLPRHVEGMFNPSTLL